MDLHSFLAKLDKVKEVGRGEFVARCPVHDDKNPSLNITQKPGKDGKMRILLDCKVGRNGMCTPQNIVAALGLKMSDLIVDNDGTTGKPPAEKRKYQSWTPPDWMKTPAKVYRYEDKDGRVLFEVCRYERYEDGVRAEKTFRQRTPQAGGRYKGSVDKDVRDTTLYRMPKVTAAVAKGETVYLVEGEKDVETMERLGFTATTKPCGAEHWTPGYTAILQGADVVILPDLDEAPKFSGQEYGWLVAEALSGRARSVRLYNLADAWPEIPAKGDVTDMVDALGDDRAKEIIRAAGAAPLFNPAAGKWWESRYNHMAALYDEVPGYTVKDGKICFRKNPEQVMPLADFVAVIVEEVTEDDGQIETKYYSIDGWTREGKPLKRVRVKVSEFQRMTWAMESWGVFGRVYPSSNAEKRAAFAIQSVGELTAVRTSVYSHTGWRRIDGQWCFLYQGGAIGKDGVSVSLGRSIARYNLRPDGSGDIPLKDAVTASLMMRTAMSATVAVPLQALCYLAPLREFLEQQFITPQFGLMLMGQTGSRKSSIAAVAMSHFGQFSGMGFPATFNDTANSIEKSGFWAKDVLFTVDDLHPVGSALEKRQQDAVFQRISRAWGDGAGRGRLEADASQATRYAPRSMLLITGEYLPDAQASGIARFFVVNLEGDEVKLDALTKLQDKAQKGYLTKAMEGYIQWLIPKIPELLEELHPKYLQYRVEIAALSKGHARASGAIAHLLIGYEYMLKYFVDCGAITAEMVPNMMAEARALMLKSSDDQARDAEDDKPSNIFLSLVGDIISSGTAAVEEASIEPIKNVKDRLGWFDADYYYLNAEYTFARVSKMCSDQGRAFPITKKSLFKYLKKDGVIVPESDGTATRVKRIGGKPMRLLWIPRGRIDGEEKTEKTQQMAMTPVHPEDLPF